jgi:hypothetical protein
MGSLIGDLRDFREIGHFRLQEASHPQKQFYASPVLFQLGTRWPTCQHGLPR